MKRWMVVCMVLMSTICQGDEFFPPEGWKEGPNPVASPSAIPNGELSVFAGQFPKSLNYYLDANVLSAEIFGAMFETLLGMNPVSLEYEPGLAERWSISGDKRVFTFYLKKNARWSDGTPLTAHDVRWTYDAVMNPEHMTGPHKISLARFDPPEVLDDHTIRFRAKDVHWRNLGAAGSFQILSRRAYGNVDFNSLTFTFPVVSGPYKLGDMVENVSVSLIRRSDWWNIHAPGSKGMGNFQALVFRFFAERENAFEAFKKGQIDFFPVYTARLWVNETSGERFDRNWIVKQKIYNRNPIGFQGFAMNMRKPPFDDVNVRRAMAHLLDREKMNRTLMYGEYFLHRSYYEDLYSEEQPCPNEPIQFDKGKARAILKEAGWIPDAKTGLLKKDGRTLSFHFLSREASTEKFIVLYAEDLKDAGIELIIDKKDWAAWARDMEEYNYQMTWAAWASGVFKDPESMFSSAEADHRGGNNITGFKDPRVDALIETQKSMFDIAARNAILREIDRIVYESAPYVLLWNINYIRLLYWNRFGMPDTVLSKYGDESSAYWYWWVDEDGDADLRDAMDKNLPLPRRPLVVEFDTVFGKKRP